MTGSYETLLEVVVKEQIHSLVKLQQEDQTLDRLRRQVLEGPQRINELEREIEALEQNLEADKRRIQEVKKAQRVYEAEVEDGIEHINKSKARLMTIKSNREYQALLKELEDIERTNTEKEDKILQCMEEIETISQILEVKQRELSSVRNTFEEEKRAVDADIRRAREQICETEKCREGTVKILDPKLLARYGRIKASSGGTAVVVAENATCGGCHMNIPAQMYNELHGDDSLKFCPHCGRIIYWKGLVDAT
jgi:hypothetical protein